MRNMKKGKNPAKKAKPAAVKKPVAKAATKKPTGLLSKLKGALGRKPVKAAKKAVVSKAAASKPKAKSTSKSKARAVAPKKKPTLKVKVAVKPAPKKPIKAAAAKASPVAKVNSAPAKPTPTRRRLAADGSITEGYIRSMKEADYMDEVQTEFFRQRLFQMREEVLQREVDVKERLHEREVFADPADRATAEEEHWLDLRLRERESLLLKKIDDALRRIENKEYGYCEKTGDPIGIPRLLARPTATVCVDVKGQDERVEAQFRDR